MCGRSTLRISRCLLLNPRILLHVKEYILAQAINFGLVGNRTLYAQSYLLTIPCNFTRHGSQGMHNEASKATLEHEFGTSNDREVIFHILEKGEL
jgi:hypothetical protein